MKVKISTIPVDADHADFPQEKKIDWSNSSDRKWLMNHLHWAMMNRHEVTLWPYAN